MDYDELASQYDVHRHANRQVLEELIKTAELGSRSRVLEVGCGTGNYIAALQSATGCSAWGVDPSAGMLATADECSQDVTFRLGNAENLKFTAERFDLVFSVDVAHHLSDHGAYFREAYRVLAPGGRICTVTDSTQIIRAREPLATYFPETVQVDLARYPRIPWLQEIMMNQGFHKTKKICVEFGYSLDSIEPYAAKAFSCLHLIPDEAFERGLCRMEEDLCTGPIPCTTRYVLLWGVKPGRGK
jgi:ubiquinone/menaquinone biosynthesis C-methylase UbiE